jgi:hypothetical protein
MASSLDVYRDVWGPYISPEEASTAATGETDKALGSVLSMLIELFLEKQAIRRVLDCTEDEDDIAGYEYKLKLIRGEESSLHRIESGLQSRLKVP